MSTVQVRAHRAAEGLVWLRAGMRLYARRPVPLAILVALGPLVSLSLVLVPWLGQALGLLAFPGIVLGMLAVCRQVDEDRMPGLSGYFESLAATPVRLRILQLGVVYALVVGIVGLAWALAPESDGKRAVERAAPAQAPGGESAAPPAGVAPESSRSIQAPSAPAPAAPSSQGPAAPEAGSAANEAEEAPEFAWTPLRLGLLLVTLLVTIPTQLTVVFATVLVAWHGQATPKALFFALFACWRNRGAILLNLFALLSLAFAALLAFASLIALLHLGIEVAQVLLLPILLALMPIGAASSYAMVRDVLVTAEAADAAPPAPTLAEGR